MNAQNKDSNTDDQRWRFYKNVTDQLNRLAQETGGNCHGQETADGWKIALEYWTADDDAPSLRINARFNDPATSKNGWSDRLDLSMERDGETTHLLTLAWQDGIHDATPGLNTIAEHSEGPYAGGKVMSRLRRDIQTAQQPNWHPTSRAIALSREPLPTTTIDATFQPVTQNRGTSTTQAHSIPNTALLRDALGALPADIAADAQKIFGHFIAASAHGGQLRPEDIAAFVQEGMAELLAFQEAHLEGKSHTTGLGVGLKGLALIGALITAMGAETMTGVFAFGPIIGHSIAAAPLAGVGSLLLGGGLMPLAKPGWERRVVFGMAVAWALAVSSLSARNPQLAEPAQSFFQMQETTIKARERAVTARLNLKAANDRLANARKDKTKAGEAYLGAKRNRPRVLRRAEAQLKRAEQAQTKASAAWVEADSASAEAMKTDPSRGYAEAVIFVLTSVLNMMGPFFIGKFLERAEGAHANALGAAREKRRLKKRTRSLRKSRKTQEAKAQTLLAAMRGHYTAALRQTGRHSEAAIEHMTAAAFGNSETIVSKAVSGFRDGIKRRRLPKLWGADP